MPKISAIKNPIGRAIRLLSAIIQEMIRIDDFATDIKKCPLSFIIFEYIKKRTLFKRSSRFS